jgi:hypothetical protein
MIRMLISIALNRNLQGDPRYIRCARCGTAASALEGAPLRISSITRSGSGGSVTSQPTE